MKPYRDIGNDSGISAYDYDESSIRVQFKHGGTYEYLASDIGAVHLSMMKRLADSGDGLNAYINIRPEIKKGYSSKW